MGSQLFLHRYFPVFYFVIHLLSAVFDLITSTSRPRVRLQIAAVLIVRDMAVFAFEPVGVWESVDQGGV